MSAVHPQFEEARFIVREDLADETQREAIIEAMILREKRRGNYNNFASLRMFVDAAAAGHGVILLNAEKPRDSIVFFPFTFWYGFHGELICRGHDARSEGFGVRAVTVTEYQPNDMLVLIAAVYRSTTEAKP